VTTARRTVVGLPVRLTTAFNAPPGFIDPVGGVTKAGGNNLWGVEVRTHPDTGEEYILAGDMDSGLWIFQDP
jgi:hypothetical protein